MNIVTLLVLLGAGFGTSFLVLDFSRAAARHHWPMADGAMAARFRPFPVFLALFAGPALFASSIRRMQVAGTLSAVKVAVAGVIASGWAICYGLVIAQGAWRLFQAGI